MKIVFFGTPVFAVPSLDILNKSKHEIKAVVTSPDKERGRGRKVSFTPIKEYAISNKLQCLQPDSMEDEEFIESLNNFNADLFVIVAFRILPKSVYSIPKYGSFNLHGSLLPKYRGAAPIHWAIINGEKLTGVTTFFLEDKVDTGTIILQAELPIKEDDDLGTVHDKMSLLGADVVLETVDTIETGILNIHKQDSLLATPAPKITKELGLIDWDKPAHQIHNLIRGLSPFPGAYFIHNNLKYKVFKSSVEKSINLSPGEIKQAKDEIFIGCVDYALQIFELQPEGRKRLTADTFLRGYSLN